MSRIGIMGGTFDPIHKGHLMLGEEAYRKFHLDKVWFMPNGRPPHKNFNSIGSEVSDRIEMVKLAIKDYPYFELQLYEAERSDTSYTYTTMEHFKETYPEDEFFFIIGADSLFAIETWYHPERIFPNCRVLAAYRDEMDTAEEMLTQIRYLNEKYHADIELLDTTSLIPVASHEVRELLKEGKQVDNVPEIVLSYIRENKLYQTR